MIRPVEYIKPQCCPMCGSPARPKMLVAHIQTVVAAYYHIKVDYMWSAQRSREIAWPRQIAMYLSRELTALSLPSIGRRFGNRDHTTIIYGIDMVQRRIRSDPSVDEDVRILRERLTADEELTPVGDLHSRSITSQVALVA